MANLVKAVNKYAERFHADTDGHHVASPLGAWLLTALTAGPASDPRHQGVLEHTLGMGLPEAFKTAQFLLTNPHPAVHSAAAVWNDEQFDSDKVRDIQKRLRGVAQVGRIPSQDEADAWTRRQTLDLIDKFPVELTPDVLLVLATALATKITWENPFDTLADNPLGFGSEALHTDCTKGHHGWLHETPPDGIFAVHSARSADGLAVYSVSGQKYASEQLVLKNAYLIATDPSYGRRMRLDQVALGDGHSWALREEEDITLDAERYTVTLPAWSAKSKHNLMREALGIPSAAEALVQSLATPQQTVATAVQSAVATYGAEGFEAAALSTLVLARAAAAMPTRQQVRYCDLRFDHPYAVVAVAERAGRERTAWDGLPVFSGWVADPR